VRPWRSALWKKMWNPRWQPRNGCDGRLMVKILITTIQVNLVPNPCETLRRQHIFIWIVIIKIFAISLHFLAAALDFTSFFTMAFFRATLFLQQDCFGLNLTILHTKYVVCPNFCMEAETKLISHCLLAMGLAMNELWRLYTKQYCIHEILL